jgi:hypothetical protein
MRFGLFRLSAILLLSVLSASAPRAHGAARSFCADNFIASLTFSGIPAVPLTGDLCQKPEAEIPSNVMWLILEIGRANRNVARAIGQSFAETFPHGVPIYIFTTNDGSIASETINGGSVMLSMFPDWNLATWPKVTYAHEVTHFLIHQGGAFAPAVVGLKDHPFITEGMPDLVAFTANNQPIMPLEDQNLPVPLRVERDATPTKSLNDPMANYTLFAPSTELSAACAKIPSAERTLHTKAICAYGDPSNAAGFYGAMPSFQSDLRAPTTAELAAPFDPAKCMYKMRGWNVFGACNTHQFTIPLASFFFGLQNVLGRPVVADWIKILKAQAPTTTHFACNFLKAKADPAELDLRGITPSLRAIRDGLVAADRPKFDRVWTAHGFDKLAQVDALFIGANLKNQALTPLSLKNPKFPHNCSSPFVFDPAGCDLECHVAPVAGP